ncbi:IWS1 homolog, partial [Paramuricea clavata]
PDLTIVTPSEVRDNQEITPKLKIPKGTESIDLSYLRETREPEPEYIPKTVEVTKRADESNKMRAVGTPENVKGMKRSGVYRKMDWLQMYRRARANVGTNSAEVDHQRGRSRKIETAANGAATGSERNTCERVEENGWVEVHRDSEERQGIHNEPGLQGMLTGCSSVCVNGTQAVNLPKEGTKIKFKNHRNSMPVPFVIYADFESILVPEEREVELENPEDKSSTDLYQTHKACSFGLKTVCHYDDKFSDAARNCSICGNDLGEDREIDSIQFMASSLEALFLDNISKLDTEGLPILREGTGEKNYVLHKRNEHLRLIQDFNSDENGGGGMTAKGVKNFISDFDQMMQQKKEDNRKAHRRRKNVDIINDNDDLVVGIIKRMQEAAKEDKLANEAKQAATKKLKLLPTVLKHMLKIDLMVIFVDSNVLPVLKEWITPLPDGSLPHIQIREGILTILEQLPPVDSGALKVSGIGKAIMYLFRHPKESRKNKERAGKIISEWSRPIFGVTANFKSMSREEREERDYANMSKRRRLSSDGVDGGKTPKRIENAIKSDSKALRPGDKGWCMRARVPAPSNKDYVVRPKSNAEYVDFTKTSKKTLNRFEKQKRKFNDKKGGTKQRAVEISLEGRKMTL